MHQSFRMLSHTKFKSTIQIILKLWIIWQFFRFILSFHRFFKGWFLFMRHQSRCHLWRWCYDWLEIHLSISTYLFLMFVIFLKVILVNTEIFSDFHSLIFSSLSTTRHDASALGIRHLSSLKLIMSLFSRCSHFTKSQNVLLLLFIVLFRLGHSLIKYFSSENFLSHLWLNVFCSVYRAVSVSFGLGYRWLSLFIGWKHFIFLWAWLISCITHRPVGIRSCIASEYIWSLLCLSYLTSLIPDGL